ncbi:hypothetical protein CARUB_v10005035mg [Capsella rubella]|uniref:F-box domain-containing protein n=1 Tax=Capsella rubella TaxID=81985 RepID=R0GIY4_9BRAS|nr:F-box/kelch-repeat protein At4g39550 [Capsella rubella]EOA16814.1 hypothetical protein CARUB_v10005035mg [Capsella rubella]
MSSPPTSTAAVNGKEPSPETTFSSLPDDLVLNCLARLSRLHYPTLSLVSKRFRLLLASPDSPDLYTSRSLLHRTESCLYVCLRFPLDPNPRWFTLWRRPDRASVNREKPICNLLVSIPSSPLPSARCSALVAVGSHIYNIGGTIDDDEPSSRVLILDCRYHSWEEGPSMIMRRDHPAASVLDGKLYVAGGCKDIDSPNWIEVFEPKFKTWEAVSSSCAKECDSEIIRSTEIDGKVYMCGSKGVSYNPKDGICEPVEWNMCKGWAWFSSCVIDNVLYYYYSREFKWFDASIREWRIVQGLESLDIAIHSHVKLADYGGKMAVFWDMTYASDSGGGFQGKQIWCAEVEVERNNNGEILGRVELFGPVLEVPEGSEFVGVLAATV